jgi:hypothetical protein
VDLSDNGEVMTIDFDEIYVDQAMYLSTYGDRQFFSAFTPHGIRKLDEEYGVRIRNINNKIVSVEHEKYKYLGKDNIRNHIFLITWKNDHTYRFAYSEVAFHTMNIIKTLTDDAKLLKKDIEDNPHLHKLIKKNLLLNLRNYTKHNGK